MSQKEDIDSKRLEAMISNLRSSCGAKKRRSRRRASKKSQDMEHLSQEQENIPTETTSLAESTEKSQESMEPIQSKAFDKFKLLKELQNSSNIPDELSPKSPPNSPRRRGKHVKIVKEMRGHKYAILNSISQRMEKENICRQDSDDLYQQILENNCDVRNMEKRALKSRNYPLERIEELKKENDELKLDWKLMNWYLDEKSNFE